jgi:hypothetical protein
VSNGEIYESCVTFIFYSRQIAIYLHGDELDEMNIHKSECVTYITYEKRRSHAGACSGVGVGGGDRAT